MLKMNQRIADNVGMKKYFTWPRAKIALNSILIIAVMVVARDYWAFRGKNQVYRQEIVRLEADITALQVQSRSLREYADKLVTDPQTIEKLARDKLGMTAGGEEVVKE